MERQMELDEIRYHGYTFDHKIDYDRLTNNLQRVFSLFLDGNWHNSKELMRVGGDAWGRRTRQLREEQFGALTIYSEREQGGLWRYRMAINNRVVVAYRAIIEKKALPTTPRTYCSQCHRPY